VHSWIRPLFVTLLLMASLFLPAPAWARGNGGHSGRAHGSHHRAHHGSAFHGAPCGAVSTMPSRCGAPTAPGQPAAGTHADAPAPAATALAAPGPEGP
jgi:hypothetical protein